MNVLEFNTLYKTENYPFILGGAEFATATIAEEMVSAGANVLVVHCVPGGQAGPEEINSGYKTISLENKNIYWPFDQKHRFSYAKLIWHLVDDFGVVDKRIHKIVREFKPDIAILNNMGTLSSRYIDILYGYGIPMVLVMHDYYYVCVNTMAHKDAECNQQCILCRMLTINRRRRLKKISSIVAVSDYLGRKVFGFAKLHGHEYTVIHNQIDVDVGSPRNPGEELRFGFLGRISRQKGALDLAYAFTRLQGPLKLIFAGDGDEDVIREIRDIGDKRVTFTGFVDKKWFFFNIDVLVVPTLWPEAFGRGVIEAQALGVPAICARSGGLPEALGAERYGWLYDPTEEDGLFSAMSKVVEMKALLAQYSASCIDRAKEVVGRNKGKPNYQHLLHVLGRGDAVSSFPANQ